jgi:purine-nucleoside phosphorylase
MRALVGPTVSTNLFYDPEEDPAALWSALGVLAVEMEAATIFTIAAMHGVRAGSLHAVSDTLHTGDFVRITDDALREAEERLATLSFETLNVLNGQRTG